MRQVSPVHPHVYGGEVLGMGPPGWEDVAMCLVEPSGLTHDCLV